MSIDPRKLRELFLRALPAYPYGEKPRPENVYFPPSHRKALHPDTQVVVGMRGAGKSFWWAALQDANIRKLVAWIDRYAEIEERTKIRQGFGEQPDIQHYPDKYTLKRLLDGGKEPSLIWRTVVVHNLMPEKLPPGWEQRVIWVEQHPEEVARWLEEKDRQLTDLGTWALVLFDALDRAADRWEEMYALIRGLLQVALDVRFYRRIRIKCFLRTDQMEERRVATFADASKVIASSLTLSWPRPDLYGLLWQYLANAEGSEKFREWAKMEIGIRWNQITIDGKSIWQWHPALREEEEKHRALFHRITGPWMGRDPKRGFPYTWLPGHLADAYGRTSPRSFLAALRHAAEDVRRPYPEHEYALHYESIKQGVQHASGIRVRELAEDYPWVDTLMQPLRGLVVPCDFATIEERWKQENVMDELRRQQEGEEAKLLPAHIEEGYPGLRRDLEALGIFLRMEDGRINIPDVFRVGYGLGRRGGVKPRLVGVVREA